jgi:flagellar basal-body rod protein FlgG
MPGIAELATAMMSTAQRRMVVTATNLSNVSTPSFRSRRVFSHIVDLRTSIPVDTVSLARNSASRALKFTGNPFDIAAGDAVLLLRAGDDYVPVNSVQLRRDAEGRLADGWGRLLQAVGGGDIVVGAGTPSILADGTVLADGQAVGRIGLFAAQDAAGTAFSGLPEAAEGSGVVHQGYLVPADVDPAAEMVELTRAGRLAETGARVFQIYDDLLGRAAAKLGDLGR